ncbi:MAG: hypothetical protein RL065_1054 [Bacteroidota bacterium]
MNKKITHLSQLDLNSTYSYSDYLNWKLDEIVELIKGKIYRMSPAPLMKHQKISSNLHGEIYIQLKNKPCQLFEAPFDVRLVKNKNTPNHEIHTVVEPDICVICDEKKIDKLGCIGAPDWIIEILSQSTLKKDLNEKFNLYESNRVKEYWIVNPDSKAVMVYLLKKKKYIEINTYDKKGEKIPVNIFTNFTLQYDDIFKGVK